MLPLFLRFSALPGLRQQSTNQTPGLCEAASLVCLSAWRDSALLQ